MNRLVLICCVLLCAQSLATQPLVALKVGDPAPKFQADDDRGQTWSSVEHVGRRVVVVYFYPADMSGVCTRQALEFEEHLTELRNAGIMVLGISGDTVKSHQLFKRVNGLNFALLSDADGKVAKAFGVPVRQGGTISRLIDGHQRTLVRGVTAQRWTFVIGTNGEILHKITATDPSTNCQSVLNVVRQLTVSAQ